MAESIPIDQNERTILLTSIHIILPCLLEDPSTNSLVASTKGVLALAMELYLELGRGSLDDDKDIFERSRTTTSILVYLLSSPLPDFKEIFSAVGFDSEHAAIALIRPLYLGAHGVGDWIHTIPVFLNIHLQLMTRQPAYYRSLPAKTVMYHLCDILTSVFAMLSDTARTASLRYHKDAYVKFPLLALTDYFHNVARGHSWLIYGLRLGLLPLILQSASYAEGEADTRTLSSIVTLLDELRLYAIHKPILRRLVEEPDVIDRKFSSTIDNIQSGWAALLQGVGHAQAAHTVFDSLRLYSPECKYEQVLSSILSALTRQFLTQLAVHRCGESIKGRNFLHSSRSTEFLRFLVEREMKARESDIQRQIHDLYNQPSAQPPFVFHVDYCKSVPPVITVKEAPYNDFCTLPLLRIPILMPFVSVLYGTQTVKFLASTDMSGNLFGWMDSLYADD
ncbi:hypothetical protein DXG01_006202 [Tephrocybe rancida]|nr:hypothetical protein DXG01_006202 [Tephrocybe rancida]